MRKLFAPSAEDVPFLELMAKTLIIHGLKLLVVGRHRRGEAEAFWERGDEDAPLGFLFVAMLIVIWNGVIFGDELLHPREDLGIGFIDALGGDIEL